MTRVRFFVGQGLLAFLPALVVLLLARDDPGRAADLSVTFGLVGALFSIAYFGQRAYVSLRGFEEVPGGEAIAFRVLMTLLAAALALLGAGWLGMGLAIAGFAVCLKLSEGILDLWLGIRIHLTEDARSSRAFLAAALARALAITAPLFLLGAGAAVGSGPVAAYLLGLAVLAHVLVHRDARRLGIGGGYRLDARRLRAVLWALRGFVAAMAVCAVLSALPRVLLPASDRGRYEPLALALSIVPVFGLACQSIWLSNLRRLSADPRRHLRRFVLEVLAVPAASAALWPLLVAFAEHGYRLEAAEDRQRFAAMVIAGVVFTAAVSFANLFKLSLAVRHESVAYALGIATLLAAVFGFGASALAALPWAAGAIGGYVLVVFPPVLARRPAAPLPASAPGPP